ASFYGMFSLVPRPAVVAHVCDDIACFTRGAEKTCADLEKKFGLAGSPCHGGKALWICSPCLWVREPAPAAMVSVAGERPKERVMAPATAESIESLMKDAVEGRLPTEPDVLDPKLSVPQAGSSSLRLLSRIGGRTPNIDDYRRLGGYSALDKALK